MPSIVPSDIYPAVRRFLLESGLARALKAFDKETAQEEEPTKPSKKARALAELELTEACQLWLDARATSGASSAAPAAANGAAHAEAAAAEEVPAPAAAPAKKKRRKSQEVVAAAAEAEEAAAAEEEAAPAQEERPKKRRKKSVQLQEAAAAAEEAAEEQTKDAAAGAPGGKKDKKKEKADKKPAGVPFSRIDHDKWVGSIKDNRLKDNTHKAKDKFGESAGDSWGDMASEDLLKVKGKGFRKEMAKKKRASWRGGGEIDQGVNSIAFSDSE